MRGHAEHLYEALLKIGEALGETPIELQETDGGDPEEPAPVVEPVSTAPFSKKNMFIHHDVHPLLMDVVLLKSFGIDWLAWEAETLWAEIQRVFKQPPLPVHNKNKIQELIEAKLEDE